MTNPHPDPSAELVKQLEELVFAQDLVGVKCLTSLLESQRDEARASVEQLKTTAETYRVEGIKAVAQIEAERDEARREISGWADKCKNSAGIIEQIRNILGIGIEDDPRTVLTSLKSTLAENEKELYCEQDRVDNLAHSLIDHENALAETRAKLEQSDKRNLMLNQQVDELQGYLNQNLSLAAALKTAREALEGLVKIRKGIIGVYIDNQIPGWQSHANAFDKAIEALSAIRGGKQTEEKSEFGKRLEADPELKKRAEDYKATIREACREDIEACEQAEGLPATQPEDSSR